MLTGRNAATLLLWGLIYIFHDNMSGGADIPLLSVFLSFLFTSAALGKEELGERGAARGSGEMKGLRASVKDAAV